MNGRALPLVLIGLLLVWSIYRRYQRTTSRQQVKPRRMALRIGLFVVVAILIVVGLAAGPAGSPLVYTGMLVGILVGAGLAIYGMTLTDFEFDGDQLFYKPNRILGLVVFLVFILRLVFRLDVLLPLLQGGQLAGSAGADGNLTQLTTSPLTEATLFLYFSYFAVYYALVWNRARKGDWESTGLESSASADD